MKPRYYLYRMGNLVQLDYLCLDDLKLYQGYYCLDMGHDLQSPTWGMVLGGNIQEVKPDNFPTAFKAHLLILDVP
jgi:hypothetical protein